MFEKFSFESGRQGLDVGGSTESISPLSSLRASPSYSDLHTARRALPISVADLAQYLSAHTVHSYTEIVPNMNVDQQTTSETMSKPRLSFPKRPPSSTSQTCTRSQRQKYARLQCNLSYLESITGLVEEMLSQRGQCINHPPSSALSLSPWDRENESPAQSSSSSSSPAEDSDAESQPELVQAGPGVDCWRVTKAAGLESRRPLPWPTPSSCIVKHVRKRRRKNIRDQQ
ncbi:MAG: hypothetical protein M1827_001303 [Pycnora praestabilis]|nr:MAG: hypothetical protein M1827_001303 [Pycnora praestabilis]